MPTDYLDTVPEQLLRLPERGVNTGTAQKGSDSQSCVPSAESARKIVQAALVEDQQRSAQRAVVKGQYDGNPPYNQAKLKSQGMGWCANFNWLGMEGRIDGARVPYYALFSSVDTYVTAWCSEDYSDPNRARWEQWYAQMWTKVHDRWRGFKWQIQNQQFEMLYSGKGPVFREDDTDWRFRAIPEQSLLVPRGSHSCVDKRIPWMAIRVPYRIHELFSKIRNEKAANDTGWSVTNVQNAIKWNTKGMGNDGYPFRKQSWEAWQQRYKNHELEVSETSSDTAYCDHLFVQEYGGKISHYIFTENTNGEDKSEENKNGFLFERKNRYDSYDQAVHVAFQNTGDGTWHSVRGMAYKSFKAEATMDRLNNRAVDNAFLSSGLTLQTQDARSKDRLQLRVTHGIAWIPPGVNSIDRNASHGQIEGVLAVARYVDAQVSDKLGNFQQRSMGRADGRGEQPTATQVQAATAKEASLSNGQIDNYYLDLDTLYSESNRRLKKSQDDEAKWFRDQCLKVMPREVFDSMEVRANRISGYGSPAMRKLALQESFQLVGFLNPEGKQNWLDDAISTTAGPDKINSWNPKMPAPSMDDAIIVLENVALQAGERPIIVSGMNNVNHLVGHLADAEEVLAPAKAAMEAGQLDPAMLEQALRYVSVLGPHCEEHLELLRPNPSEKQNVQLFQSQIKNLVGFNGQLYAALRTAQQNAKQAAMEQQQANAVGLLDQKKAEAMDAEIQRQNFKAEADIDLKAKKTMSSQEIKRWQADQNNKLKTAQTAEQINRDRALTAAEMDKKARLNGNGNGRSE